VPAQPPVPPLPVQLVAPLVVQLSMLEPPEVTVAGFADRLTVGAGTLEPTMIATDRVVLPPEFVHVRMNVAFAESAALVSVPLVALVPVQPPLAVQLSAFGLDHVSVVVPSAGMDNGLASSVTVGPLPLCL
jgi:hypothetical protein